MNPVGRIDPREVSYSDTMFNSWRPHTLGDGDMWSYITAGNILSNCLWPRALIPYLLTPDNYRTTVIVGNTFASDVTVGYIAGSVELSLSCNL